MPKIFIQTDAQFGAILKGWRLREQGKVIDRVYRLHVRPEMLRTDGRGLWSSRKADVLVRRVELTTTEWKDEGMFYGNLHAYFDVGNRSGQWDTHAHGLIYTDDLFESELRTILSLAGYAAGGVHYSEQGMQGDDFVDFDVDQAFIDSVLNHPKGSGEIQ